MKASDLFWPTLLLPFQAVTQSGSQNVIADTNVIREVQVVARITDRPLLREPGAVAIILRRQISERSMSSLLPALNMEPGVRMEERSPGSYRLAVRGSLLRSSFGVRNLKVYIGEMPLTNAAGETYLNLLDQDATDRVEIHKGPDGSIFGANSGGVLRLRLADFQKTPVCTVSGMAGSYGLYRTSAGVNTGGEKHKFTIRAALQAGEGYRDHSEMRRHYLHAGYRFTYGKNSLELLSVYSALEYETPGGLTFQQFTSDPRQARPATATLPGAVSQRAGVRNNTALASLTNRLRIGGNFEQVTCVFGSLTDFNNPFITNYETRFERNAGFRAFLLGDHGQHIRVQSAVGSEMQVHYSQFSNFANIAGLPGPALSRDVYSYSQLVFFASVSVDFFNRLLLETSASSNVNRIAAMSRIWNDHESVTMDPQLMPRIAGSFALSRLIALRAIVSRGYSVPTLQELRPVPRVFNRTLQPESGWNYEAGLRAGTERLRLDVCGFVYRLTNAITRRVDSAGAEYFVNAGQTFQPGVEAQASWAPLKKPPYKDAFEVQAGAQVYNFRFVKYKVESTDYSGNRLTGVPPLVLMAEARLPIRDWLMWRAQANHVSGAPLDDSNQNFSPAYTNAATMFVLQLASKADKPRVQLTLGCDNLFNQHYTLGPDLNAFGGRFYNPAPNRNFFAQLRLTY